MNPSSFTGEISVKVYEIHQEMRGKISQTYRLFGKKDIQESEVRWIAPDTLRTTYQCCSELCKRSGKDKQRHLRLCRQMAQIVSNTTTPKLNMELKNVNTVLKLNMADTRVEDIESDSYSSGFDNDDFSDDSDNNHYQKIARDIFGDSDSEDNELFEGFPIQMPENVNWTLRRATCPAENRMICTYMTNLVKDLL